MKANKALKRIGKIESLTSDVMRRLAKGAPHVNEVLEDLKAAVVRVKEAVSTQVSSHAAKKKAAAARKKAAAKKTVAKASTAKTTKKASRAKAVKKAPKAKTVRKVARAKRVAAGATQKASTLPRQPGTAVQEPAPVS
jgi:hypothetical protein